MEQSSKKYFYVIGVLVVALIGMYLWKTFSMQDLQKQQEVQQQNLVEKYQKTITENTRQFLRLAAIPLVWAIKAEMLKENYEQINEFLIQFVKEPHIKQILVAKIDGMVVVATDKKMEGAAFSTLYPSEYLEKNETMIADNEKGNILIVSPIMAFNRKLGIFLMVYEPEKIALDAVQ